jgi:hypothetical protein
MGEGAGVLVLEELDHALARGATPLAEVAGYGSTADAYRITDIEPDGKGAQKAMAAALRQAGIDPKSRARRAGAGPGAVRQRPRHGHPGERRHRDRGGQGRLRAQAGRSASAASRA